MKSINKQQFEELISTKSTFVVDFWAPWCHPCIKQKPLVEKVAYSFLGQLEFYTCDCDIEMDLAGNHRVLAIPTIMLIKQGKEFDRIVGISSESEIKRKIESMIKD